MNIEERLEALTHSVELLAGMQIETEKRITRLAESVERLTDRGDQLQKHMATLADGMAQLTRIALDHDERISGLEGNQRRQ
jgi:hypothetical protein